MQYREMVDGFRAFYSEAYEDEILAAAQEGKEALLVDFSQLLKQDTPLADAVLTNPDEAIAAAEEALQQKDPDYDFRVRFSELPDEEFVKIRNLRSQHLGTLVGVHGLIKRASEVRPEVVSATFECTDCGDIEEKEQDSAKLKSPYKCANCGNRKFELLEKEMVDVQAVNIEEDPKHIEGSEQPRDISILLQEDLVDPDFQKKVTPGNEVDIYGVLRETPREKDSKRYDLFMEGNYLQPLETQFEDIDISDEEEAEIKELSKKDDIFPRIVSSIAPSIYGHERVKEAVALQLFSGVRKKRPDGTKTRGDMHLLLIGEPGTGKSQILQFVGALAPKGKYVVGKSATGAGITATVVKDDLTDTWSLEAGALVLANEGIATVDEIDKMSKEDRSSLHEAMEQQTISVSKANIQATLQCRTAILAAGNPKFGRFDPYQPIPEQINIGDTLLSRFDLIFPVRDVPDEAKDTKLAAHIMELHTDPDEYRGDIETDLLRKYIAYAKTNVFPKFTDEAQKRLQEFYVNIRKNATTTEDGSNSVPMTARQLEALIRMSEAAARARLSDTVDVIDAERAIDLLTYCLKQIGTDPDTGEFDIDRIESGISTSDRNKLQTMQHIINTLQGNNNDPVPIEDVLAEAEEEGLDEKVAQEVINRLKREGELFEPKNGHIQKI